MTKRQNNLEELNRQLAEALSQNERLRAQLLHLQKMEAIGRLSSGVAHDFNNILTGIRGHAELAIQGLPGGDDIVGDLEQINRLTDRGASLTRQILAFSRRSEVEPVVLDADTLVRESVVTLSRIIGERFEIECDWPPGDFMVRTVLGQLDQILYNLTLNARDSMPGGGKVTISVSHHEAPADGDPPGLEPGEYVVITVSDEGCGMDRDTMDRAFEAFFTTKEIGKGTGLGLSVVKDIVESHNGLAHVTSEPGQGATFSIYMPGAGPQAEAHVEAPAEAQQLRMGNLETVMVVEDEESVRLLMRDMLVALGYRVVVAENGAHALRLLDVHGDGIDLVLSDVIMPVMGGIELSQKLARLYPGVKVVHTSGYPASMVYAERSGLLMTSFLAKPFSIASLSQKVREALEMPRSFPGNRPPATPQAPVPPPPPPPPP